MLIQHTRPRLKPPGYAVLRVRRDHPLAVGLVGCFVQGGQFGLGRDLVTGQMFVGTNTPTMNMTPDGPAVDYSGTALTSATSQPIWNVLGAITLAWRGIVRTPAVTGFLVGKIPAGGGGGTDTPFSLEYCNPTANRVSFVRSNTGGTPFRVWQSGSNLLTANALTTISVSQGADISVAPLFYLDGAQDAAAAVSQYGGAGTGAATSNTAPVQFGRRPDGAGQHAGQTTIALLASRQWSAQEHQRFAWAPYEVLEEAPTYHFLAHLGQQVVALTAESIATGAPTLGTPTLGQIHALTATGIATGAPALGAPTLGQVHAFTATGIATGAPALGTPTLAQVHALTANGIATGAPVVGVPILNASPSLARTVRLPARSRAFALPARDRAVQLPARDRTTPLQPERS